MIAEAAENAGIGFECGDQAQAVVQGIAARRDQIARDQGQVRFRFVGCVNHALELRRGQKGAEMDICQLQQPQPFQIRMQSRNLDIDFTNVKFCPLDQRPVSDDQKGRGQ